MSDRERHVSELAAIYRRHFTAPGYREGSEALDEAERYHRSLAEAHGEAYAREVDRLAYRIGHG